MCFRAYINMLRLSKVIMHLNLSGCVKIADVLTETSVSGVKYTSIYCYNKFSDARYVHNSQSTVEVSDKQYEMFYRFPHVRLFATMSSLKRYSTVIAIAGVPSCFLLSSANLIDHDFMYTFFGVGLVTNVLLYSFSVVSNKIIGSLYLSTDGTTVKISYLNFWGKRINIYCPKDDVVPISEIHEHFAVPCLKFKQYSTSRSLLFPLHFGNVLNKHIFTKVFGDSIPS